MKKKHCNTLASDSSGGGLKWEGIAWFPREATSAARGQEIPGTGQGAAAGVQGPLLKAPAGGHPAGNPRPVKPRLVAAGFFSSTPYATPSSRTRMH